MERSELERLLRENVDWKDLDRQLKEINDRAEARRAAEPPAEDPPSPPPLSLSRSTPLKPFDKLPDELLDHIAFFANQSDLQSLALVEQRWYDPARCQTEWFAYGFDRLMEFAELLLQRPRLAPLIRRATLHGGAKSGRFQYPGSTRRRKLRSLPSSRREQSP
ncbi:hypothetical protein BCR35DRAFT_198051 [Leucosporidium creatinivorum]|uniref:F-box domain-containing protein n=1 Tax=Leucosporidium creatinivorum TaxID=106004 RepID=A0A1Y2DMK7_9BASI|nr:hypothetical protein BCR35DRAFT_198051 [Leucosporidium creatinivorum]